MADTHLNVPTEMSPILQEIKSVLDTARSNVARQVNSELLGTYWNIGRIICEYDQSLPNRADYGKQTLKVLSSELTKEFGKGFSRSNLQNMRQFYLSYEKCQTLSGKLSWSHYCELLSISDPDKRSFYEKEAVNSGWSVRELKRQIESSLFERLLLSRGDANREQVLALALHGNEINPFDNQFEMALRGAMSHRLVLGSDARGNLIRMENALANTPARMGDAQTQLDTLNQQMAAAKEELGKPFPQEAELQEKSARLITLNALLNIDGNARSEPEQADEKPSIHDQLKAPGRPGSNQHNTPSQRQEER